MEPHSKHTILVIENEEFYIAFLEEALQGYDVLVARNAQEALEHLDRSIPDLAIVDLLLPDQVGLGLCQTIRARYRDIPLIIFTVKNEIDYRIAAVRDLDAVFLYKEGAVTPKLVAEIVARELRHSSFAPSAFAVQPLSATVRMNLREEWVECLVQGVWQRRALRNQVGTMLRVLYQRRNTAVSYAVLQTYLSNTTQKNLRTVYSDLHKALDSDGKDILKTTIGVGYCLVVDKEFEPHAP
jgi:DNA-binding response OmpR family regulator